MPQKAVEEARALRQLWQQLAPQVKTQAAWAAKLGISEFQLSRALRSDKGKYCSPEIRQRIAQWLGAQCADAAALAQALAASGWVLTPEEQVLAEAHLQCWQAAVFAWAPPIFAPVLGRAAELAALEAAVLAQGAAALSVLVVQGVPGIGKSALVSQLLRQPEVQRRFPLSARIWLSLDGQDETFLWTELAQALQVALPRLADPTRQLQAWRQAVLRELGERPVLIVLDGVSSPLPLRGWTQRRAARLVLTTPRLDALEPDSRVWEQFVWKLPLGVLAPAAAVAVLTQDVSEPLAPDVQAQLLSVLGGVPLALHLANRLAQQDQGWRWLAQELTPLNAAQYLDLYPGEAVAPEQERQVGVARALGWSYQRLQPAAQAVFRGLGFLSLPLETAALRALLPEVEVGAALRSLQQWGLVTLQGAEYQMHSLVQGYARQLLVQVDEAKLPEWQAWFVAYYAERLAAWRAELEVRLAEGRLAPLPLPTEVWGRGYKYALAQGAYAAAVQFLYALEFEARASCRREAVADWYAAWQAAEVPAAWQLEGLLLWAKLWTRVGDLTETEVCLRRAHALWTPQDAPMWEAEIVISLFGLYLDTGQLGRAMGVWRKHRLDTWVAQDPTNPRYLFLLLDGIRLASQIGNVKLVEQLWPQVPLPEALPDAWHRALLCVRRGAQLHAWGEYAAAWETLQQGLSAAELSGDELTWCQCAMQGVEALLNLERKSAARALWEQAAPRVAAVGGLELQWLRVTNLVHSAYGEWEAAAAAEAAGEALLWGRGGPQLTLFVPPGAERRRRRRH